MIKIKDGKQNVYFDVDDTLVEWVHVSLDRAHTSDTIYRLEPATPDQVHLPISPHIDELKRLKEEEGATIVVWSQGGSDWAEIVVKALGLEEYVDVCLTKPSSYYDDLHCDDFMPPRRYVGPPRLMR